MCTPRATKAQRKRQLAALFAGAPAQPRDDSGRFTSTGSGFDGGARPQTLRRAETHDELIARLALEARVHRGSS